MPSGICANKTIRSLSHYLLRQWSDLHVKAIACRWRHRTKDSCRLQIRQSNCIYFYYFNNYTGWEGHQDTNQNPAQTEHNTPRSPPFLCKVVLDMFPLEMKWNDPSCPWWGGYGREGDAGLSGGCSSTSHHAITLYIFWREEMLLHVFSALVSLLSSEQLWGKHTYKFLFEVFQFNVMVLMAFVTFGLRSANTASLIGISFSAQLGTGKQKRLSLRSGCISRRDLLILGCASCSCDSHWCPSLQPSPLVHRGLGSSTSASHLETNSKATAAAFCMNRYTAEESKQPSTKVSRSQPHYTVSLWMQQDNS